MGRGERISSPWGISTNIVFPVLLLEFIHDFHSVAKTLHPMWESFVQDSSAEIERNDDFITTLMKQPMDRGLNCAVFHVVTEQNSNPAPGSLRSNYKAKGNSQMQKRGAHIHAQT